MSMILNFNGVEEAVASSSKSLQVGIQPVVIVDVELKKMENDKGSEYIAITLRNEAATQMNEEKFFVNSEKAVNSTLGRIKHLIHNAVGEEASEKSYSIEDLKKLLVGKSFRANIVGEEFLGSDGVVYVRTQLPYGGFAESLSVPIENSGLKAKAIKKLKGAAKSEADEADLLTKTEIRF